uniref:Uncharacterized protein n=1 Tax=Ditylenchus dipsaci TaxID=166011 RepID=A0A915D119_9BILA
MARTRSRSQNLGKLKRVSFADELSDSVNSREAPNPTNSGSVQDTSNNRVLQPKQYSRWQKTKKNEARVTMMSTESAEDPVVEFEQEGFRDSSKALDLAGHEISKSSFVNFLKNPSMRIPKSAKPLSVNASFRNPNQEREIRTDENEAEKQRQSTPLALLNNHQKVLEANCNMLLAQNKNYLSEIKQFHDELREEKEKHLVELQKEQEKHQVELRKEQEKLQKEQENHQVELQKEQEKHQVELQKEQEKLRKEREKHLVQLKKQQDKLMTERKNFAQQQELCLSTLNDQQRKRPRLENCSINRDSRIEPNKNSNRK